LNQAINALKFYYGSMLKEKFIYEVKRPTKDKKLPTILNKEEITRIIIRAMKNIKHKAILMTIYSGGLRVSEAARLMPEDLDRQRMLIHIKGSKGRKDRYTKLSEKALKVLDEYMDNIGLENGFLRAPKPVGIYQEGLLKGYLRWHAIGQGLRKK